MQLEKVQADWNVPVIVAASGPSLTEEVAWACRRKRWFEGWRVICVNDAYKRFVNADILYGCDERWWEVHSGAPTFRGEKWSSHSDPKDASNDKRACADKFGLRVVYGRQAIGFSTNPACIHYGHNSGFQAVNLAILKGATRIVLVGFDMRVIDGKNHFFGRHPEPLVHNDNYGSYIQAFKQACPPPIPIVNATPDSALDCFPKVTLAQALMRQPDDPA